MEPCNGNLRRPNPEDVEALYQWRVSRNPYGRPGDGNASRWWTATQDWSEKYWSISIPGPDRRSRSLQPRPDRARDCESLDRGRRRQVPHELDSVRAGKHERYGNRYRLAHG